MDRSGTPTKILLGMGVFKIGNVAVGLTRGGGQFTVEREYRPIVADGDKGEYKGRISQDTSKPKLKMNALEVISENLTKLYPGLKTVTTAVAGKNTFTVATNFASEDTVTFANITLTEGTDFNVGSDAAESAANLTTELNTVAAITTLYTITSAGAVITITEKVAGGGNTPGTMYVAGTGVITAGVVTTSVAAASTKVTGKGKIEVADYNDTVTWTGETKGGKQVIITLYNAINLDNIDWTLAEKDEAIAAATYVGTYLEDSPADYEPWDIVYVN